MAAPKQDTKQFVAAQRSTAPRRVQPPKASITPEPAAPVQRRDDQEAVIQALRSRLTALEEQVQKLQEALSAGNGTGEVTLYANGNLNIHANADVQIDAPGGLKVNAATVKLGAAFVEASGVLKCDTLVANHVEAASYSPGAGNIW